MPKRHYDDDFSNHILDLLAPWSGVNPRRMFSGIGLFVHGKMFALIFDDVLYLKDSVTVGKHPLPTSFEKEYIWYEREGKEIRLGYFKAPDRALEESAYLIELAKVSYQNATLNKKKRKVVKLDPNDKRLG
jgi:DNA transformation protein